MSAVTVAGARDVAEEGDLSEIIARMHPPGWLTVDTDLDFASCEDVEAVAVLSWRMISRPAETCNG